MQHLLVKSKTQVTFEQMLIFCYLIIATLHLVVPIVGTIHILLSYFMVAVTIFSPIGYALTRRTIQLEKITSFLAFSLLFLLFYFTKWSAVMDFSDYFVMFFLFAAPFFWSDLLLKQDAIRKRIRAFILTISFITCITTIVGNELFPYSSRLLAGAATEQESCLFRSMNIGGYQFVYGMVILLPYLFYGLKTSTTALKKAGYLIFIAAILYMEIKSQYTIAVIISGLILLLLCVYKPEKKLKTILLGTLIVTAAFAFKNLAIFMLDEISYWLDSIEFSYVAGRFQEVASILRGNSAVGDANLRVIRYSMSAEAFFHHPLFGRLFSDQYQLGGHSEILDILGGMGLVGFPWFLYLIHVHCKKLKKINPQLLKYAHVSLFAFLILSSINTSFFSTIGLTFFAGPFLFHQNEAAPNISRRKDE